MNTENLPAVTSEPERLPVMPESDTSPELQGGVPRFVIYGSRVDGVFDFKEVFTEVLRQKGIPDSDVVAIRDIANIEKAFYGKKRNFDSSTPDEWAIEGKKGLAELPGAAQNEVVLASKDTVHFGGSQDTENIPAGVMVFPTMRQYDNLQTGMTIETPVDRIQKLCQEHGVPMVYVEKTIEQPGELTQNVDELLALPGVPAAIEK